MSYFVVGDSFNLGVHIKFSQFILIFVFILKCNHGYYCPFFIFILVISLFLLLFVFHQ